MRRRLIGLLLLFSAGLFLIANLFNVNAILANTTASSYVFASLITPILTSPFSLFSSKLIIDDYNKHNWNIKLINTLISGILGAIYAFFLISMVTQSWMNTGNNITFALEIPFIFQVFMIIFGIISGSLLGWFASTISFISLGISIVLSGLLSQFFTDGITPIVLSLSTSFLFNLLIISSVLGFYAFFGKTNKNNQDNIIERQKNHSDLFNLLELAKNKKKILSKAEIISELKLDIKTVDSLLKEAEINQLCTVELDENSGSIRYKFDV
ncbi:hypothetical protein ACN4EE_15825 [Geminocystis sp. CENA526]|uniref:hypothetical protein n=1 Tax=Geminocystis sp. CENA526 TaxID=1355871 RepID=UPI003D6F8CF6